MTTDPLKRALTNPAQPAPDGGPLIGSSGLYWWADPARHDYRVSDPQRPEEGCFSCGYLANRHDRRPADPPPGGGDMQAALYEELMRLHANDTGGWLRCREDAAALAPVVARLCEQRAAEALREAADEHLNAARYWTEYQPGIRLARRKVLARADALDGRGGAR